MQVVIGEGHMLGAHWRVSLCQQQQSQANQSDDELEYAAKDAEQGAPHPRDMNPVASAGRPC